MFALINSVGLLGLNAFAVKVEIEASKGLPSFDIVGLADASVKESRERVRSALRSSEITLPLRKNNHKSCTCRCEKNRLSL